MKGKIKLIVILGPTASGKTKLAVDLARQFEGEIISADSRQVYRGMDIGTGKDLAEYGEIRYHLLDVADPESQFSVAEFKLQADRAIVDIYQRGRVPMLVGGSGLYLQAVVDNFELTTNQGADAGLRTELEKQEAAELYKILSEKNRSFAERLNNSDKNNKRRLIRYIELNQKMSPMPLKRKMPRYDCLVLGLRPDQELLEKKIKKRLSERLEQEEMINEVEQLQSRGVSDQRLKDFGLEYKFITEYLEEKYSYEELVLRLNVAIRQFAKRQLSWFKRWEKQGQEIKWLKDAEEGKKLIEHFLSK